MISKKFYYLVIGLNVSALAIIFFVSPEKIISHEVGSKTDSTKISYQELDASIADYLFKAEYYFSPDQYDLVKAEYYYRKVISLDPDKYPLAWYQLSRIEFLKGNFSVSISLLNQKIDTFGDAIPNVYYMKGLNYAFMADKYGRKSNWKQSEKNFLRFLDFFPNNPWARIDLAWVYFSLDEFNKMGKALEPLIVTEQDNPWFLNMYALALFHNGEQELAKKIIQSAYQWIRVTTVEDWASVYPENNPRDWPAGLNEFKTAVEKNYTLITNHN